MRFLSPSAARLLAGVTVGLVAVICGFAQVATASGNGGLCEMMRHETNMGTPEYPNWVVTGSTCVGPCPPSSACIVYPTPTEIRDSEGVLTGLKWVCWCYGDNGTPGNPYDDIISYDGSSAECDTAAITNAGGQFFNTECIKAACPSPCLFGEDPNITPSLVEYPPGSGIWRDRRFKECRCP